MTVEGFAHVTWNHFFMWCDLWKRTTWWKFDNCDMIKGNKSHVGNIQFWFFNITICTSKMLHFDPNSTTIRHLVAETWTIFEVSKQCKTKKIVTWSTSRSILATSDSFPLIVSHFEFLYSTILKLSSLHNYFFFALWYLHSQLQISPNNNNKLLVVLHFEFLYSTI